MHVDLSIASLQLNEPKRELVVAAKASLTA